MPQRQSTRGPPQLRTSSSDSDPIHHRPISDRSPKIGDRRSPRGSHSDPVNQKKLGTRIAGLETQLDQAQVELKILKEQLASAEAAKREAQEQLEKKTTKPIDEKRSHPTETEEFNKTNSDMGHEGDGDNNNQQETDVFEVPVEKLTVEPKVEFIEPTDEDEDLKVKPVIDISTESPEPPEPEKSLFDELSLKNDEISMLKAILEEKEKKSEVFCLENETLKTKLNEATLEISCARQKEEEMSLRLTQLGQEVEASKGNVIELNEKLQEVEKTKEALEAEMKRLRVQTEQWRKAAEAAAAVLAGGVEMNGRGISERCGSMDKQFGGVLEGPVGGYGAFVGSPGLGDESDDGYGGGKRKGSSRSRMFGDLWKKKGQK